MLLVLRREALWPGSAALMLLQRRFRAVAATTSLQISSVLLCAWAGDSADAATRLRLLIGFLGRIVK